VQDGTTPEVLPATNKDKAPLGNLFFGSSVVRQKDTAFTDAVDACFAADPFGTPWDPEFSARAGRS
jgi:hypothetical protein